MLFLKMWNKPTDAWINLYKEERKRRTVVEKALLQTLEEKELANEVITSMIVRLAEEKRRGDMWRDTVAIYGRTSGYKIEE